MKVITSEIVLTEYTVKSKKIKSSKGITFVYVSDLHSKSKDRNGTKVSGIVNNTNPDFVLLGGDIANDKGSEQEALSFVNEIKEESHVFYAAGNHETRSKKRELLFNFFEKNTTFLKNDYCKTVINGEEVIIAGAKDLCDFPDDGHIRPWFKEIGDRFKELEKESCLKILLSHRPELFEYYNLLPFDIVISGHAHGGQWRIPPFKNGIIAPGQGFFPCKTGGLYQYENFTHIIGRGASTGHPKYIPRIFNPPEVLKITVTK